jgi:hypothetical protein
MLGKLSVVSICLFAAILGTPAQAFDRLSEDEFNTRVVGKLLRYKRGGQMSFNSNGTIQGDFPSGPASGSWQWDNGKVCSQITVGTKNYAKTCRSPETEGDTIRFVQEGGKIFGEAIIE